PGGASTTGVGTTRRRTAPTPARPTPAQPTSSAPRGFANGWIALALLPLWAWLVATAVWCAALSWLVRRFAAGTP
ncbi:MAG TPA: hypothetical protein VES42_21150, partial [Pilimelia sp.]|nr:hypothetical protein [Pilimelia sp.]